MEQFCKIFNIDVIEFVITYGFYLDSVRELVFIGEKLHFSAGPRKKVVVIVGVVNGHMRPEWILNANVEISDDQE